MFSFDVVLVRRRCGSATIPHISITIHPNFSRVSEMKEPFLYSSFLSGWPATFIGFRLSVKIRLLELRKYPIRGSQSGLKKNRNLSSSVRQPEQLKNQNIEFDRFSAKSESDRFSLRSVLPALELF